MRKTNSKNDMKSAQQKRFWEFISGDDFDFYEQYIMHLPFEEQKIFFEEFPDFMSEYSIDCDKIYLLKGEIFKNILQKIRVYEGGKRDGVN